MNNKRRRTIKLQSKMFHKKRKENERNKRNSQMSHRYSFESVYVHIYTDLMVTSDDQNLWNNRANRLYCSTHSTHRQASDCNTC